VAFHHWYFQLCRNTFHSALQLCRSRLEFGGLLLEKRGLVRRARR
jgi:hypothetical protein